MQPDMRLHIYGVFVTVRAYISGREGSALAKHIRFFFLYIVVHFMIGQFIQLPEDRRPMADVEYGVP